MVRKLSLLLVLLSLVSARAASPAGAPKPAAAVVAKENLGRPESLVVHGPAGEDSPVAMTLKGKDARQQLLVTARFASGAVRDFTRQVRYQVTPAKIVDVNTNGLVVPLANGTATITVRSSDGSTSKLELTVTDFESDLPINFPNQIVPIFTKTSCNGGGCHGKASGQNGFKLSLLGFEPTEDYEHLVREARGRRLFPASPENSLLLLKGTAQMPHGGGKRLDPASDDYRMLVRWMNQGMPYGKTNDPVISKIEVFPKQRTLGQNASQQLIVLAHYTDGTKEDVTRSALFEPNDKNMAKTDDLGHVTLFDQPGDVAVMVRYQAKVAVFRATIPLGAPVENLPPARNFIDELVFTKLKTLGLPPSGITDDATFLRRVTIDIAGRTPSPEETEAFMKNTSSNKRDELIDSLIASTDYAAYFANKWSALLRNKRSQPTYARGNYAFWSWIRDSLIENKPFDQFAREVVAASGDLDSNPAVGWYRQVREPKTQLEDTAQLFLGLRLQCAQCHHHPYEKWSQQDYYSFAAFFSQVGRKNSGTPGEEIIFHRRGNPAATNIKTKQAVKPAGLGTDVLDIPADEDPRLYLTDWLSRKDNPFFARSLVNRYWKHFFGRGLVDPEDDMRETNPASNPDLLNALAEDFVSSGYDLKHLVRTIARSTVYQLSAEPNAYNKIDKQNFSRFYPRRLPAEVLFDGVNQTLKAESRFDGFPVGGRAIALPDNSFNANSYFLTVFGRPESSSACECERSMDASLAQSLHLLNAKEIQDKIAADGGRAAALAGDTTRDDDQKIRELYLWAYSRSPLEKEVTLAKSHIAKIRNDKDGKPLAESQNRRMAYEDIVWALINTKEFLFNH
ncbi:MAG TPA: DUF1549 domain-containing protein [Roseimicrobium sp.]|nr:DUF1549 domain-containing protein [Roseimicrobium sp.]